MKDEKYIWEILVPHAFNDGERVPLSHHHKWDTKVLEIANGMTLMKPASGKWRDVDAPDHELQISGKLYNERMIPVRIACTEQEIKTIANFTLKHYKQIKVMFYCIADKVHIYP